MFVGVLNTNALHCFNQQPNAQISKSLIVLCMCVVELVNPRFPALVGKRCIFFFFNKNPPWLQLHPSLLKRPFLFLPGCIFIRLYHDYKCQWDLKKFWFLSGSIMGGGELKLPNSLNPEKVSPDPTIILLYPDLNLGSVCTELWSETHSVKIGRGENKLTSTDGLHVGHLWELFKCWNIVSSVLDVNLAQFFGLVHLPLERSHGFHCAE